MGEDRTCYGGRALTRLIGLAYPAGCSLLLAQARPDAGTESYTMESQAAWRNAKDGQLSPPKTDTHPRWWGGEGFNANSVNLKSLTNEIVSSLPIAWKKEKENGSKMLMPPPPVGVIGWLGFAFLSSFEPNVSLYWLYAPPRPAMVRECRSNC